MGPGKKELPHQKAVRLLEQLARHRVPCVIVGGAALALHGIPRSTLDVDIVVLSKAPVILKLFRIAETLGLKCRHAHLVDLADRPELLVGQWMTFTDESKRELVDVLLESEKEFRKLYQGSRKRRTARGTLRIASLNELEKMKKASGRPIDLADISLIRELKRIRRSNKG